MTRAWILLAVLPLAAQEDEPIFHSETRLATVSFHVVRDKRYVEDLKPQDIVLLEDGQRRQITFFEGGRTRQRRMSVDVALLFDISGSVIDEGLLDMTTWKSAFLDTLPATSLAVYAFDSRLLRFCKPTRDPKTLEAAFNSVLKTSRARPKIQPIRIPISLPPKRHSNPNGGTWIFESLIGTVDDMTSQPGASSQLIVVFSDGFPTTTSVPEDAAKAARDAGVALYPVALGHWKLVARMKEIAPLLNGERPNEGAQRRMDNLRMQEQEILEFANLGELTGGRSFDPPMMNSDMLRRITAAMVGSVLTEYVAGFTPDASSSHPGKHRLAVKLASKESGKLIGGTRIILH
jgi:VWFA-related protein